MHFLPNLQRNKGVCCRIYICAAIGHSIHLAMSGVKVLQLKTYIQQCFFLSTPVAGRMVMRLNRHQFQINEGARQDGESLVVTFDKLSQDVFKKFAEKRAHSSDNINM